MFGLGLVLMVQVGSVDGGRVSADAGAVVGGFNALVPATWKLPAKLGHGAKLRELVLTELTAPVRDGGVGETALGREEAEALLDDPRAELVYADRTIAIVAPSMLIQQRKDHLDLKKMFLQPERLDAGVGFEVSHEPVFTSVEQRTGVNREVIVAILMWETKLGTITGDYRAFNAFTSQAFFIDEASAVAMAKKDEKALTDDAAQHKRVETIRERAHRNLLALVRQCKTRGIDPLEVKGSWAGALGYPQFMPASLRWAEDGDGDGKIDLFNFDDSIASVGRYLQEHGFAQSRQKAVWEYNHEAAYVEGVLAYADALQAALGRTPDAGVPDAGRAATKK